MLTFHSGLVGPIGVVELKFSRLKNSTYCQYYGGKTIIM